jgi:hypothetical protein
MATPKLALIPTGYKAGKLYSVLPESGVGDFTVVRATEATRVNEEGLIETMGANVPRLDYSGGGCPVLLTEPQSTNKIINSENLLNGSWGKTNAVVESNSTISPDGILNADKLTFNISSGFGRIISSTLSSVNSISFFVKYIDLEYILIFVGGSSNGVYVNIKEGYATSTILGAGLDVTFKKYTNDWLRIEAKGGNNATSLEIYAANSTPNYTPITLNGSFYLWGVQAEASYPTSYIKTEGSAVTRNADQVYGAGDAATFNDSEGVLMVEISALSNDITNRIISVSDGSGSNRVLVKFDNSSNLIQGTCTVGTDQASLLYYTNDITINSKVLFLYKSNDFQLWVDGFKRDFDTNGTTPSGLDRLNFDNSSGGSQFYGKTSQIQYFNTVLTDSELEKLTSWTSFIEMAQGQNYNII